MVAQRKRIPRQGRRRFLVRPYAVQEREHLDGFRPVDDDTMSERLGNPRIYAVLYGLWRHRISVEGPRPETVCATAVTRSGRFFELYAIRPEFPGDNLQVLREFLQGAADAIDGDKSVILKPALLVVLEPATGTLIWGAVTDGYPSLSSLRSYIRGELQDYLEEPISSIGFVTYSGA